MKRHWHLILPLLLVLACMATRWPGVLPYNFSAVYALAFCGAIYFQGKLGWWLPLAALLVSDVVLNVAYYKVSPFDPYLLVKLLACLAIVALAKFFFSPATRWFKIVGGGILAALIFYFVTNSASWWYDPGYPKTLAGWIQALTVGLPGYPPTWEFFRSTLLSGGLFAGLFAGAMKLSPAAEEEEQTEEEPEPENASPEEA